MISKAVISKAGSSEAVGSESVDAVSADVVEPDHAWAAHFERPSPVPETSGRLGGVDDTGEVLRTVLGPARESGPLSATTAGERFAFARGIEPLPSDPVGRNDLLEEVRHIVDEGIDTRHPWCVSHLHCPTLTVAAITESVIGATNQSMDSYDQAPMATAVEDHLVRWLGHQLGMESTATSPSGVMTSGGTASNLLGLALAREQAALTESIDVRRVGMRDTGHWRILTSADAHFSVVRASQILGFGSDAVLAVPTDDSGRVRANLAEEIAAVEQAAGRRIVAVVATAGTTDLGAVDPLDQLADLANRLGAWFHVDAAVGAALCVSGQHRGLLAGIESADSVTVDFHKLWFQPVSASALVVRDGSAFSMLREPSDYLDRDEDVAEGVLNLAGRSLETSRRFDALKVISSLRSVGRDDFSSMVDHLVALAHNVARRIGSDPRFELLAPTSTFMVLFAWRPEGTGLAGDEIDRVNTEVQRELFASGEAVVGRTRRHGRVALKFTFTNPLTSTRDVVALLERIHEVALDLVGTRGGERAEMVGGVR